MTDAIAADITKYGDSGRRTLFVIYDPDRHLGDGAEVVSDITRHPGMFAESFTKSRTFLAWQASAFDVSVNR